MNPALWYRIAVFGWLLFFGAFMGVDMVVWITRNPHIPTFSRVVCHILPWWVTLPLVMVLFIHFYLIYFSK